MSIRISSQAAAARERSRRGNGRFGEQEFARSMGVDLDAYGLDDDWATAIPVDQDRLEDAEARRQEALSAGAIAEAAAAAERDAAEREAERARQADAERVEAERRARQARDEEERQRAAEKARRLAAVDQARSIPLRDPEETGFGPEFIADLQAVAERKYAHRGFDPDELVGEAAIEILEAERAGKLATPSRVPRALIDRVMRSKAVKEMSGRSSRDVTTYMQWAAAVAEAQEQEGRELTHGEQDALAERIRLATPAKNRPAAGYHRKSRATPSLDEQGEDGGLRHDVAAAGSPFAGVERTAEEQKMLELAERLEAENEATPQLRANLARRAWSVNATLVNTRDASWRRPVPTPLSRQVPVGKVAGSVSRIREAGGAVAVARSWLDGDDSVASDLFTPFGDLPKEDRDAVADFLLEQADEHGEGEANAMYKSAASQSRADAMESTSVEVDRVLGLGSDSEMRE